MKSLFCSTIIVALLGAASLVQAQSPQASSESLPTRPSHEKLLALQKAARERMEQQHANKVEPGALTERKKDRGNIIDRSTILSYGKSWTIVPKGAVLHVPSFLSERVEAGKNGRFVSWPDFYQKNRGWIHLQPVKMNQARGEEAMPEGAAEAYPNIGRVVVAVCHGGPISVRAFKGDQEQPEAAAGETAAVAGQ